MREEPKLTPWFPPAAVPVRRGVYQRRYAEDGDITYSLWDGYWWRRNHPEPAVAAKQTGRSHFGGMPWRGLAKDPK